MLEFSEEIPFLWRLSAESVEGFSHVSMVIPFQSGTESLEHTIPTSVVSFCGDHGKAAGEETLEWNEDDIQLFLKLLATQQEGQLSLKADATTQTFKVDLTDPAIIEIVNIVAAAGFGMAMQIEDILITKAGDIQRGTIEPELGANITLNTVDGYKRGIVVGVNDDEIVCVLLDRISLIGQEIGLEAEQEMEDTLTDLELGSDDIFPHDIVIVKPHQLLPAGYSSLNPVASDIIH
jgi:hypothetical protein